PQKANGTTCTDGNACTQSDTCQAGACVGANPVVCTASDECHSAGTCDTTTGVCSNPAKPNGSACHDGNACTQGATCQAGPCAGPPGARNRRRRPPLPARSLHAAHRVPPNHQRPPVH